MSVLVAYASANGSTAGIAERIVERLREHDLAAKAMPFEEAVAGGGQCDALVMGSAIHGGTWLPGAPEVAWELAQLRSSGPVWLFSVSSVGETSSFFGPRTARLLRRWRNPPPELEGLRSSARFRGHRNFAGVIREGEWGRLGNAVLRLLGGQFGDHRDWSDIDAWANAIAGTLTQGERRLSPLARTAGGRW